MTHKSFRIINKDLYDGQRKSNKAACEVLRDTKAQVTETKNVITTIEDQIAEWQLLIDKAKGAIAQLEQENKARQQFVDELLSCGFCDISTPKELIDTDTGIVIKRWEGHTTMCRNNPKRSKS